MDRMHALEHDGRTRYFDVHLPEGSAVRHPLPVVLNFHGGLGSADSQRRQSRMDELSDERGFLVVYPEGTGRLAHRLLTFNAGSCCGYAKRRKVDDVGFVDTLLDQLPREYPIDVKRIYATGMSNGGMMSYRLGCELSHRIAAIGPVAGPMAVDGPVPSRPVPLIHFHGVQDRNAVFDGGIGPNAIQPTPHRAVREILAWWREVNGCAPEPVEVREERDYVLQRWAPPASRPGAEVVLCALPEGGHTWPGGTDVSAILHTGRLIESVNANRMMWEFFERFRLP